MNLLKDQPSDILIDLFPTPLTRPRAKGAWHRVWLLGGCLLVLALVTTLRASDWPTYQADYARSGVSPDRISAPLSEAWVFRPTHPPQPAWNGEAKRDAYSKINDLRPRQIFDKAFHVVIAGDALFFGSSADDQVRCLEAATGKPRWTFFTEGPVRFAPTIRDGQVYVGSDDGCVYCLNAGDGSLRWRTRVGPRDYRIPANGRLYVQGDRILFGMDAYNGTILWTVAAPEVRRTNLPRDSSNMVATDDLLHVAEVLYSEKRAFDLRTGRQLRSDLPERRGCGTMAASMNSFFYRNFFHGMWDLKTDQRTEFLGIRGGCWLGMIPSGGLVLAPETSSGCSCAHSIQTSLAYIPKSRRAAAAPK